MNKYWPIIVGVTLVVIVSVALAASQSKQIKPPVMQKETAESLMQPTTSNSTSDKTGTLPLSVVQPQNGITVKSAQIQVIGKTAPNAEIFVNDKETVADAKGNFSVAFTLEDGENYILVGANDAKGNFAEQELSVTFANGQ